MSDLGVILLIVLLVLAFGGLPRRGFHGYGYRPSGLLGTVLVIILVPGSHGQVVEVYDKVLKNQTPIAQTVCGNDWILTG